MVLIGSDMLALRHRAARSSRLSAASPQTCVILESTTYSTHPLPSRAASLTTTTQQCYLNNTQQPRTGIHLTANDLLPNECTCNN